MFRLSHLADPCWISQASFCYLPLQVYLDPPYRCWFWCFSLSRYILQNTRLPLAQFQAVSTLRDAILQQWASISEVWVYGNKFSQWKEDKDAIRSYCLDFVLQNRVETFVERQLLQTIAVMAKRGWLLGDIPSQIKFRFQWEGSFGLMDCQETRFSTL